ncbi:septation protein SepH [uncultured Amnibacterium sp.]|uniref:septation protein SepH n=1 Tax=uncultured Amnibacterium sp. TaxID=1631851 RepID=UPI0035C99DC5
MLTLSVIGVEDGVLIAASESGDRFRIPVDLDVEARLRDGRSVVDGPRITPREIQAHVRAGLSALQVAALTGTPIAYVERFSGPVLAELAYVVDTALAVRVQPEDPDAVPRTFRAVMSERLAALDATVIVWSSCREVAGGWVIVLDFVADEIQHEARWRFEPKRQLLTPDNVEATTLSQAGTPVALTPRLRALEQTGPISLPVQPAGAPESEDDAPVAPGADSDIGPVESPSAPVRSLHDRREPASAPTPTSTPTKAAAAPTRFDSAAFRFPSLTPDQEQLSGPDDASDGVPGNEADAAARTSSPTTDLLTALAQKRGRREGGEPSSSLGDGTGEEEDDDEDPFRTPPRPDRDVPAQITRGRFPEALPPAEPKPAPQPLKRPRTRVGRRGAAASTLTAAETAKRPASSRAAPTQHAPAGEAPAPEGASPEAAGTEAAGTEAPPNRPVAVPPPPPAPVVRPRRGRTTMPSWDEIVYGKDED